MSQYASGNRGALFLHVCVLVQDQQTDCNISSGGVDEVACPVGVGLNQPGRLPLFPQFVLRKSNRFFRIFSTS